MSHNSYKQKLNSVYDEAARKELEVRGERHFTIDDIDNEKKYKWHLMLACFAMGVLTACLIIHFWK